MKPREFPRDKEFLFIVDFTWNNHQLTILELGEYFRSSMSGLDEVRKRQGKGPLDEEIKQARKKRFPDAVYVQGELSGWLSTVTLEDLTTGMRSQYNTKAMSAVKNLLRARMIPATTQPLRSIVVTLGIKFGFSIAELIELESVLAKKSDCCVLDFPSGGLHFSCVDKAVFSLLSHGSAAVPATCLIDLCQYDEVCANDFLRECNETEYVIKPVSKSCAIGVMVLSKEEVLPFITRLHNNRRSHSNSFTNVYDNYWHYATDDFLLLQSCRPSHRNKDGYRPTGRAVIRATLSPGGELLPLEYLGGYWELPASNSDHLSTESVVLTEADGFNNPCVTAIDENEWRDITSAFDKHLSPMIETMFHTSTQALSQQFSKHHLAAMRRYGEALSIQPTASEPVGLLDAGIACYEALNYATPHSMENRDHLVAAVMGLSSAPKSFTKQSLQQAFNHQFNKASVEHPGTLFHYRNNTEVAEILKYSGSNFSISK